MLRVFPPRLDGRAEAGFPEEGLVSSVAVAVVVPAAVSVAVSGAVSVSGAVASDDPDRSVDAREVRFWFVGMRLDRAKG